MACQSIVQCVSAVCILPLNLGETLEWSVATHARVRCVIFLWSLEIVKTNCYSKQPRPDSRLYTNRKQF